MPKRENLIRCTIEFLIKFCTKKTILWIFLKLGKISTGLDQHHHLSDVKFLLITYLKKDFIKLDLSQCVAEIYKDDFNAFSSYDFCLYLPKVQIFHPYIIDVFRLLPESTHAIIARFFKVDFSRFCHKCHFRAISLVSTK